MTRPFVTHEQQIMGSLATADVLQAVDTPLQDGTMDWNALAPMASLMSAGDVLVQYDQAYERYDTPIPQQAGRRPGHHPARPDRPGLLRRRRGPTCRSSPTSTRPPWPGRPTRGGPAPLVSYTVADPRPIVRTESTATPLVVDGDATGIVNAAVGGPAGRQPDHPLRRHPRHRPAAAEGDPGLSRPTWWSPTPTASRAIEWNSLNENTGYTETAAQGPGHRQPGDAPLNLFPKAPADAQTTAVLHGVSSVTASSYGSSITYLPEDRPADALDGNTQTGWLDNSFAARSASGGRWSWPSPAPRAR